MPRARQRPHSPRGLRLLPCVLPVPERAVGPRAPLRRSAHALSEERTRLKVSEGRITENVLASSGR